LPSTEITFIDQRGWKLTRERYVNMVHNETPKPGNKLSTILPNGPMRSLYTYKDELAKRRAIPIMQ